MKKIIIALVATLIATAIVVAIAVVQAEIELIDTSGAWRLPFDGTKRITNGPLEGLHTGKSAEAIDYLHPNAISYQVLAPANGTVTDVFDPAVVDTKGFGWLVRINHGGTTSFFAHLRGNQIYVARGQNVKQGQLIAMTGNSGTGGAGFHLHFEARTAVTQGTVQSGNASPIRAIPGNWWNTWYSPPPNFQHDTAQPSGGAQYPESGTRPTTTSTGARHLSNQQSPAGVPAGWTSNFSASQITLHFGAAPDTPNTNWATTFNVYELRQNCNCWPGILNGAAVPSAAFNIGAYNQSRANGQHTFQAEDYNVQVGYSSNQRYWEALPSDITNDIPHLVATFRPDTSNTTLEFCSFADKYRIYEYHGIASQLAYSGTGCTIMVHRQLNGTNWYSVAARIDGIWTAPSQWLVVQY